MNNKKYGGWHLCNFCNKPIKNGSICNCNKIMYIEESGKITKKIWKKLKNLKNLKK